MPYSSWISSRGSHDDSGATVGTTLIENAAGVIESLMRDILGFNQINTTAFDTSSVLLTTTKLSFDINERVKSDKTLGEILERVRSLGMFDYDDQFKMVTYDSADTFTEAGGATDTPPNSDDIYELNPTETGSLSANTRAYNEHPMAKGSFWVKKAPASQIVTNFTIEYFKTYDGKFAETLTETDYLYHSEEIAKTFSHPYTKDQTTADFWLQFLIDRLNRKHWQCGFTTYLNSIGKELWDVVNVRHPILENLVTSYLTKKWRILDIDIDTATAEIDIELEEQ